MLVDEDPETLYLGVRIAFLLGMGATAFLMP